MRRRLCTLVILLCLPGIFFSARRLPAQTKGLVAEKYAGWSGVLRVWCFEGWTGGELMEGWIRRCAASFEKLHGGVYIEVQYVEPEAVRARAREGVRAPDMILFPPGLLDSVDGLAPLGELPVRANMLGCGQGVACPVAMGGYGWAVNAEREGVGVPADEEWRAFGRAAAALGEIGGNEEIEIETPGIDLGLTASASAASPLTAFMNGELGAVCVSQRELARLGRMEGRIGDWTFSPGRGGWTDQVMYLSVLNGGGERQELSVEFMMHLLSEESQAKLKASDLFPVTEALAGYPGNGAMAMLEAALRREGLEVAPAFHLKITQ